RLRRTELGRAPDGVGERGDRRRRPTPGCAWSGHRGADERARCGSRQLGLAAPPGAVHGRGDRAVGRVDGAVQPRASPPAGRYLIAFNAGSALMSTAIRSRATSAALLVGATCTTFSKYPIASFIFPFDSHVSPRLR